jgi:hypothetical protein
MFDEMLFILRRFRHSALFLFASLAMLAVSLGASATMFTVVHTFLLSSLPYKDADRLVMIWNRTTEASGEIASQLPLSPGAFADLHGSRSSFEQLASFFVEGVNVKELEGVSRTQALLVTGDFFPLLGRTAVLGRTLRPEDEREASPRAWSRQTGIFRSRSSFGFRTTLGPTHRNAGSITSTHWGA